MSDNRDRVELILSLRRQQRAMWAAGEHVLIEQLIAPHPEVRSDLDAMSDLIVSEIAARRRQGETPTVVDYVRRFPSMEARVRQVFEVDAVMADESAAVTTALPDIPGYVVLKELGRGGGGIVYQAQEKRISRLVAIKLAHANGSVDDLKRFRIDAEAASRLKHPNIVSIYRVGAVGGSPFFTMELADGGSLASRIAGRVLPARLAAELMEKIARAMQHAHQAGVVHRDLKPANIILTSPPRAWQSVLAAPPPPPRPKAAVDATTINQPTQPLGSVAVDDWSELQRCELKVTDFGMARLLDDDSRLTKSGFAPGTARYMSPEHASGNSRRIDARSDLFSLGVMLYELLTGSVPFAGENDLATIGLIADKEPVPPRQFLQSIPADLETICLTCLRKEPEKRYSSAEALAEDLRRYLQHEPILAKRPSTVERVTKWCRRRPVLAGLYVTIALLLVVSLGLWLDRNAKDRAAVTAEAGRAKAEVLRIGSDAKREIAEANQQVAEAAAKVAEVAATSAQQQQRRAEAQPHLTRADVARNERFRQAETVSLTQALVKLDGAEATAVRARVMEATQDSLVPTATSARRIGLASVQYSPDGKFLVTGDLIDQFVRVWDMQTGRQVGVIDQHVVPADRGGPWATVRGLAFDPAHRGRLISAGLDGTICAWDLATLTRQSATGIDPAETDAVLSLAVAPPQPDGRRRLLTGHRSGRLVVRDLVTLKPLQEVAAHSKPLVALAVSAAGTHWASASQDGTVRVWSSDGQRQAELQPPAPAIKGAAIKGADAVAYEFFTVAYSQGGSWLAASGSSGAVHVWEATSRKFVRTIEAHQPGPAGRLSVRALGFLNDRQLVSGGSDGFVRIWNAETGEAVRALERHEPNDSGSQAVWSLAIHPEEHQIASTGQDGTIRVWETQSGRRLWQLEGGLLPASHFMTGMSMSVAYCPSQNVLLMSGVSTRSPLRSFDTQSLRPIREFTELPTLAPEYQIDRVPALAIAPNGERFVSAEPTGEILSWDTKTGARLKSVQGHAAKKLADEQQAGVSVPVMSVSAMTWSPVGNRIASVGFDRRIKVWDAATLESQADWADTDPESQPLSVPGADAALAALLAQAQAVMPPDQKIVIARDNERLITAGRDEVIRVWSIKNKAIQQRLRGHVAPVSALATDASGTRLASGATDGMVVVWDIETGRQLRVVKLEPLMVPMAFGTPAQFPERMRASAEKERLQLASVVRSIAFSSNGLWLAVALGDGTVSLVNLTSSEVAYRGTGHEQSALGSAAVEVYFTPRGELISAGNDQTVRRWDFSRDAAFVNELAGSGATGGGPSIQMSPDGSEWLVPTNSGAAMRWPVKGAGEARSLRPEKDSVQSAVWLPDGKHLLVGTILGQALVVKADDQTIVRSYRGPANDREPTKQFVASIVAVSADGKLAASSWLNGEVDLWNVADGSHVRSLPVPARLIRSLAFHPRRPQLAIADDTTKLYLWDYAGADADLVPTAMTGTWQASSLAYSPDGRRLVVSGQEFESVSVAVIDPQARVRLRSLAGHQAVNVIGNRSIVKVNGAAFSHDGRWLATCASDATVRLWSVRIGDDPRQDDFRTVMVLPTRGLTDYCRDTRPQAQATQAADLDVSTAAIGQWLLSVAFSRDDRQLATAAMAGPVVVFELSSLFREAEKPASEVHELSRRAMGLDLTAEGLRVRQNLRLVPASAQ